MISENNIETTTTTTTEKSPIANLKKRKGEPIEVKKATTKPSSSLDINDIDTIMAREKLKNKNDIWSKIDKTVKTQKLHAFAEKYGKDHSHSMKEIKALKIFFINALEHGKLQKTKDVHYDKECREIIAIPALVFDANHHTFTLKNLDIKRVSTLKSLTPKRATINNTETEEDKDNIISI
jgi:hypothetical protein